MESCPCSIFDVREEQILEPNGSLHIRLICNMCGTVLDSKFLREADVPSRTTALRRTRRDDDLAVESSN